MAQWNTKMVGLAMTGFFLSIALVGVTDVDSAHARSVPSAGCTSEREMNSVPDDATRAKVARHFGTWGKAVSTQRLRSTEPGLVRYRQVRKYRTCSPNQALTMVFVRRVEEGQVRPYVLKRANMMIA